GPEQPSAGGVPGPRHRRAAGPLHAHDLAAAEPRARTAPRAGVVRRGALRRRRWVPGPLPVGDPLAVARRAGALVRAGALPRAPAANGPGHRRARAPPAWPLRPPRPLR